MRRAAAVILVVVLALTVVTPPAEACVECAVALGLASFAVFTQIVAAATAPRVVYTVPSSYAPAYYGGYYAPYPWGYPGVYAPAYYPAYYRTAYAYPAPAPVVWTGPRVVQYAHGRYELRGDGVSVPYAWVWVPAAPSPPAIPPPPSSAESEGGEPRTQ